MKLARLIINKIDFSLKGISGGTKSIMNQEYNHNRKGKHRNKRQRPRRGNWNRQKASHIVQKTMIITDKGIERRETYPRHEYVVKEKSIPKRQWINEAGELERIRYTTCWRVDQPFRWYRPDLPKCWGGGWGRFERRGHRDQPFRWGCRRADRVRNFNWTIRWKMIFHNIYPRLKIAAYPSWMPSIPKRPKIDNRKSKRHRAIWVLVAIANGIPMDLIIKVLGYKICPMINGYFRPSSKQDQ